MKNLILATILAFTSSHVFAVDVMTANDLCKAFKDDGIAAQQRYKNKRIIVSGRIAKIKQGYNRWSLRLSCNRGSGMRGVPMNVNNSESSQLKILEKAKNDYPRINYDWERKYNKGKNIKFSCKYRRHNKVGVYLEGCRIK